MSQCPNCQKDIDLQEKHFGALYTCPKCQAVYFINFDGHPEYDPNPPDYILEENQQTNDLSAQSEVSNSDPSMEIVPVEIEYAEPSETAAPSEQMEKIVLDSLSAAIDAPFEIPLENDSEPSAAVEKNQGGKTLQEIVDFANSNEASTAGIEYNLKISGIDSKDLHESVKEALNDARFMWDFDKIISELKDGELVLKKISPVKASLVVSRLRFHDLDITWEQNAV